MTSPSVMMRSAAAGLLGGVLAVRNFLYDRKLLPETKPGVPVISVGNIHMGGTGKTPIVLAIARHLASKGRNPAVLIRGYGGNAGGSHVVHGTDQPEQMGDEAVMLSRMLTGITVVRGANRMQSWALAAGKGADCAILDDGLQHRHMARNLEIVVLDCLRPLPWRLVPSGKLRENISALKRADLVILSRADQSCFTDEIRSLITGKFPGLDICTARTRLTGLLNIDNSTTLEPGHVKGKRVLAFSGTGNPESFHRSVQTMEAESVTFLDFPDHCAYSNTEYELLNRVSDDLRPEMLLCTRKDAVKLMPGSINRHPIFSLETKTVFEPGDCLDRVLGIFRP